MDHDLDRNNDNDHDHDHDLELDHDSDLEVDFERDLELENHVLGIVFLYFFITRPKTYTNLNSMTETTANAMTMNEI
jgi:hypothetical protein